MSTHPKALVLHIPEHYSCSHISQTIVTHSRALINTSQSKSSRHPWAQVLHIPELLFYTSQSTSSLHLLLYGAPFTHPRVLIIPYMSHLGTFPTNFTPIISHFFLYAPWYRYIHVASPLCRNPNNVFGIRKRPFRRARFLWYTIWMLGPFLGHHLGPWAKALPPPPIYLMPASHATYFIQVKTT